MLFDGGTVAHLAASEAEARRGTRESEADPATAARPVGTQPAHESGLTDDLFTLAIAPTLRRQLTDVLLEAAAYEVIVGPLLDNPHRVGKQLRAPLEDRHSARRGTYRVVCRIDEQLRTVTVVASATGATPTAPEDDRAAQPALGRMPHGHPPAEDAAAGMEPRA